jgi:hypothetical protein
MSNGWVSHAGLKVVDPSAFVFGKSITRLILTDRPFWMTALSSSRAASAAVHGGEAQRVAVKRLVTAASTPGGHLSAHREHGEAREEVRPQEIKRNCQ